MKTLTVEQQEMVHARINVRVGLQPIVKAKSKKKTAAYLINCMVHSLLR